MSPKQEIEERNQERWKQQLLTSELNILHREQLHLIRKKRERLLSRWENERLSELANEIQYASSLVGKLA